MSETPPKKLFLVDGTSQLYRAYFAIRGLSTREGLPTNAVFGFTTMLRKLLQDEQPTHIAVAFDLGRKVFRHEQFPDYKANRKPTPDDLTAQVPYAKQVCEALGVPQMGLEGYEADDLIATFSSRGREAGFEIVVVAQDKDLYQLVGDGVTLFNPSKNELLDPEGVRRSFGVPPELVRDVLGLMGDAVDNIPGVPGVGRKTALAAVSTYGPVDAVIERAKRFAAVYEARDSVVASIAELAAEERATGEAIERIRETVATFRGSVGLLREVEVDVEFEARLAAAFELTAGGALDALDDAVGAVGATTARSLSSLKRELKALDRGSSKRAWLSIRDHADAARLSTELATLRHDVPVEFDLGRVTRTAPDVPRTVALFRSLEFQALVNEFETASSEELQPASTDVAVETVETGAGLAALADACAGAARIAIDVVTGDGGPLRSELVGLSVACGAGRGFYVPLAHSRLDAPAPLALDAVVAALGPLLEDSARPKVAHDLKSVSHVLRRSGLEVAGWALDTMVAAFLLDAGRSNYPLDALDRHYLGSTPSDVERPENPAEIEVERVASWAGTRVEIAWRLAGVLELQLEERGLAELYRTIDGPLLPVLGKIEAAGIRVDTELLGRMSEEMEVGLNRERAQIHQLAGKEFNVDSPKQLREVLFVDLGLKPRRKTAKGKEASTDAQTLEELSGEHPIAARILEYRELAKLKGTYVDTLPRLVDPATQRVHTSYHPTGAATGRLSSSDPNLQNIPSRTAAGLRIRAAFVPEPGRVFLASDYSQIELRVLAHMSGDPELTAAFRAGDDIHRHTASRVFGVLPDLVTSEMRRRAKVVNFGILYGMSEMRLAREQGIPRKHAREFIETYFDRFSGVREYIDAVREEALRDGAVRTHFGRIRSFPQLHQKSNRAVQEQALRAAVNTTVQGTAADLMKLAMLAVDRELDSSGIEARTLLQVHDELLLEVREAAVDAAGRLVRRAMEEVVRLDVPLVVDQKVGQNWMEVT